MTTIRAYTSNELIDLRRDKFFTKIYLTVFKPVTVYTALINGAPVSNDKVAEITYDTGSGTLANVKAGMVIRFGTTAGGRELGEERIRKTPSATKFYIGETSLIPFQDNAYITVVDDYQLRPKHIRIDNNVFYTDYDIVYSDQHTNFNPVVIMGSHRIGWLTGASIGFQFPQLADSWVIDSTISTYLTTCAGAIVTNGATNNPTVTISAPGRYVVYSTVTAANGKSSTGVRYIYVHNSANMPFEFELEDLSGSYEQGGYSARVRLFTDSAAVSLFEEGALVVIHCVDYFNGAMQTIETCGTGTGNILMVGRVTEERITQNKEQAVVEFSISGFHEMGRRGDEIVSLSGISVNETGNPSVYFSLAPGHVSNNYFPYGVEMALNTPDSWTDMPSLNVKRALFDLLYHYSTVMTIMDIYIEDDTRYAKELSASSSTLWEKINELAQLTIFAQPGVDQFGRLFIEIEPQLIPEINRNPVQIMQILKQDWQGSINIERNPTQRGNFEILERLLLSSQSQSNSLAGLYYGWKHNEYQEIGIQFAINARGFSLFPRQVGYIEIDPADNVRGITLNTKIIPREISYEYDVEHGVLLPEITFEAETFEELNINGDVPGSGDISFPPLPPLPSLPPFSPVYPGDSSSEPDGPSIVVIGDENKGVLFAENFSASSPVWRFWNTGIDTADQIYLFNNITMRSFFIRVTNGGYYCAPQYSGTSGGYSLYYAPALGAAWTKILNQDDLNALIPGVINRVLIRGLGWNPLKPDEVAMVISRDSVDHEFHLGNHNGFSKKCAFGAYGGTLGSLTFGGDKWVYDRRWSAGAFWHRFTADGTVQEAVINIGSESGYSHARVGTSSTLLRPFPGHIVKTNDNGDTNTTITVLGFGPRIQPSHSGNEIFGDWDYNSARRGRSSDGGYSWDGSFFTYGDYFGYAYCGGIGVASRWILGRGYVRYSPDFGANWQAKEGNLPYLIPTSMRINKILVPGYINI